MSDVKRYCEFYFDHAQTFVEIADDYGAYVRYDDYATLASKHAELLAAQDRAALTGAAPGCFVQPVPAHCDLVTWRGQYFRLPITAPQPSAVPDDPVENDAFVPGSLADLLFQLGEKGVGVSGGTHGDRWQVRLPQPVAAPSAPATVQGVNAQLLEALEHARVFIRNGVELGFITMPDADCPDPAHNTLPRIEAAIAAARKGEGE